MLVKVRKVLDVNTIVLNAVVLLFVLIRKINFSEISVCGVVCACSIVYGLGDLFF